MKGKLVSDKRTLEMMRSSELKTQNNLGRRVQDGPERGTPATGENTSANSPGKKEGRKPVGSGEK